MHAHLNGVDYAYEDLGSGIPLLCLSAFPFASALWREQHALADVARLIIPDYRGIGRSGSTEGPTTMERLADDMVTLLDHLQIDRAVLMGVSMGGYVEFALYAKYPERVRALILADTRPEADTPETAQRRLKTVDGLRSEGTAILRDRVNDLLSPQTRRENPQLVEELQRQAAAANAEGLALITLGMAQRADSRALLPQIAVPTLVLCGEDDTVSPPDGMMEMANQIPGASFALIPNAGHLGPLEQPAAFNAAVRDFLAELDEA